MQTEITIKSPCKVARLGNQWVDSSLMDRFDEVVAEFAARGLKGSLLFF
jgi:hypothetical protein